METEYAVGGFSVKREGSRFYVFCGENKLDSFKDFKSAGQLVSDLHLSKKASDDEMIGVKAFCPSAFENGSEVIVVAKIDKGYIVQAVGTAERMTVAEEYLSDVPDLFQE